MGAGVKIGKWIDQFSASEISIGFLKLYVWHQLNNTFEDKWAFSFVGYKSEIKYSSRGSAKLAGLRFAKKFMTQAVEAIDNMDDYVDSPERVAKDTNIAERHWMASLFATEGDES